MTSGAAADNRGNMSHMLLKVRCGKPSGLCHHQLQHQHQHHLHHQHPSGLKINHHQGEVEFVLKDLIKKKKLPSFSSF